MTFGPRRINGGRDLLRIVYGSMNLVPTIGATRLCSSVIYRQGQAFPIDRGYFPFDGATEIPRHTDLTSC